MRNLGLVGFAAAAVTIAGVTTSQWGSAPVTNSLFDADASPGVTVSIQTERSPLQTAPERIGFGVNMAGFDTNTPASGYDPTWHDKITVWRCRSHPYNFTAPTKVKDLDAADGGNRQAADHGTGNIWDNVAQVDGNYIYDVVVYEISSGKIGKDTVSFTVADGDVTFPGTRTCFVSTSGVFTNKPTGADEYTDIDAAVAVMLADQTNGTRVMLERDQTHTLNNSVNILPGAGADKSIFWIVARPGAGAQPIVVDATSGGDLFTDNSHNNPETEIPAEVVFSDIEWVGPFDPTDATGDIRIFFRANIDRRSGNYILLNKCTVRGFDRMLTAPDGGAQHQNRVICFCDTITTDWASNGFFGGNYSKVSFLGCEIAQNPDAIFSLSDGSAGLPVSPIPTTSGWCGRLTTCSRFILLSTGSYAGQGWSSWGSTQPAGQSAWRLFASVGQAWAKCCISYCVTEGQRFGVYFRPTSGGQARQPINGLMDKCFILSGFQSTRIVEIGKGGMNVRDCQLVTAGEKDGAAQGGLNVTPVAGISLNGGGSNLNNNNTVPIHITRITVVNLSDKPMTHKAFRDEIGLNETVTDALFYQPNTPTPDTADGPFTQVQGFTPSFEGVMLNDGTTRQTVSAMPASAGVLYTKPGAADTKPDYTVPA